MELRSVLARACIFLLASLPYILPWHYYPDGDFLTQASSAICVLLFIAVVSFGSLKIGLSELGLLAFSVVLTAIGGDGARVVFAVSLSGVLLIALLRSLSDEERESCFNALLWGVSLGGAFTLLASLVQLFGFESMVGGVVFDDASPDLNVVGNIGQRNLMSQYLLAGFLATGSLMLRGGRWRGWSLVVLAVPVGYVLALAGSRTALLSIGWIAVACCLVMLLLRGSDLSRYAKGLLIGCGVLLIMQPMAGFLTPGTETSMDRIAAGSSVRLAEWMKAWAMIKLHFPGGVGWSEYAANSFLQQLQMGDPASADNNWTHAHNLILNLTVELGLSALVPIIALGCLAWELWRAERNLRWFFVVLALGMTLIHSMLEYPLWYAWGFYFFIALAGFGVNGTLFTLQPSRAMRGFVAVLALIGVGYILLSIQGYFRLVEASGPTEDQQLNLERLESIISQTSNPALEYAANLTMIPYLRPGGGMLRLCKLMEVARVMPAADKLDLIALDAFLMNDEKFAFEVLRSRYRAFPGTDDGVLISNLGRLGEEKAKELRERIEQLKHEPFDLSKSYQLEACPEDKLPQ
ncbi:Wzy polymerase domain-containing protein [Pseudomonas tohonis]|nr:hypothetical protein L682_24760 [Pseudomonas alcaligenes OT 69]MDN4146225.1 Wzy polymerase domain-containing protein [Pseudomonas tohonis]